MLKATHFSGRTGRCLVLSIIIVGVIATVGSFVSPTLSCPAPPPQPLRQLYATSERIVIARVGKSETVVVNSDGDDNDNQATQLKTALLVSSTLKGDHEPVVYVRHYMYEDYKDQLSSAPTDADLLVFLEKSEEMDGYYVNMNYGLKKLSAPDLKVYVSRIEELGSMTKSGTPSDAQIVEWLVRCAEDPATRWEGAYELAMSHYMREQQAEENTAAPVEGTEEPVEETAVEGEEANMRGAPLEVSGYYGLTKASFAGLLTTELKYRLTTALVSSDTLTDKDYYLLDLAKRWDDPRLVPFLLSHLDRISRTSDKEQLSYFSQNVMTVVADKMGDDALKALVANFSGNEYIQDEGYDGEQPLSENGEESQEQPEQSEEQEAAEAVAAVRKQKAELQHFVTLALSTAAKPSAEEPKADPVVSVKP